jgi:hypothetical protein
MRGGCDRRREPSQVCSFINLMGSAGSDATLARLDDWRSSGEPRQQTAAAALQGLAAGLQTLARPAEKTQS